jgi:hypothetical protein
MSILSDVIAMQKANQAQALNQLKLQQAQQLFPIEQQLQQLQMEKERQAINLGQQKQQQIDVEQQRERTLLAGRLAEQALSLDDPEMRNVFIQGAANKLGIQDEFDPSEITNEHLMQLIGAKQALEPVKDGAKTGRYQQSVVGNKVQVLDSATGEFTISNLGTEIVRPPGMTDEDYSIYKTLPQKTQAKLIEKQLDPNTIAAKQERIEKVQTAKDLQKTALDLIDTIEASKKLPEVLGGVEGRVDFRLDVDEADLIADISELSNILLSDKLKLMSGVLSETDIKILKELAAGGLNRVASVDRFQGRLGKLRDAFAGKLKPESDLPTVDFDDDPKKKELEELRKELGL